MIDELSIDTIEGGGHENIHKRFRKFNNKSKNFIQIYIR